MSDQTPIPTEPYLGAAEVRKLALNTFWPMVEQRANELGWAVSEVVDERMLPAVNNALYAVGGAAHAAGLTAGRTRSGCCQAAVDSDGHTHAENCAYLLGLREGRAEGRTAAAEAIRDHLTRRGQRVGVFPPITPDAALRNQAVIEAYETAARVAEDGAQPHSCSNCEGVDPASCAFNRSGADQ